MDHRHRVFLSDFRQKDPLHAKNGDLSISRNFAEPQRAQLGATGATSATGATDTPFRF